MGIVSWIVLGAISGWIAGRLLGERRPQGCFTTVIVGIGGALLGGALITLTTGRDYMFDLNLTTVVVGVLGAVILVTLLQILAERRQG
jgi:uncharacterized membrane protein YeaQ/YmgE (transglycosylase-associated protein family)